MLRPSVMGQPGARPFTWLVYFDDRCPRAFIEAVQRLKNDLFTPVWTHDLYWSRVRQDVSRLSSQPYLITTRVDSDGALARDHIANVQSRFSGQEFMFISFPRGLQLDEAGVLYQYDEPLGPFMSLIERPTGR